MGFFQTAPEPSPFDSKLILQVVLAIAAIIVGYLLFGGKKENLNPKKFQPYKLIKKEFLTENVVVSTFELPDKSKPMGLPAGRHIKARFKTADGEEVVRSYTPSEWRENGQFSVLCKVYPKGKMSNHIKNLPIGGTLEWMGPTGRMTYKGSGVVEVANFRGTSVKSNTFSSLILLCGGSGLTPMLQIAKAALDEKTDNTPIYMLFANSTPKDTFYVKELEDLQKKHSAQFHLTLGVSRNPNGAPWNHHVGRFNTATLKGFIASGKLPQCDDTVGTAICGPPSFEKAMAASVKELGYSQKVKTMRW